jgi:hypothetical protein
VTREPPSARCRFCDPKTWSLKVGERRDGDQRWKRGVGMTVVCFVREMIHSMAEFVLRRSFLLSFNILMPLPTTSNSSCKVSPPDKANPNRLFHFSILAGFLVTSRRSISHHFLQMLKPSKIRSCRASLVILSTCRCVSESGRVVNQIEEERFLVREELWFDSKKH